MSSRPIKAVLIIAEGLTDVRPFASEAWATWRGWPCGVSLRFTIGAQGEVAVDVSPDDAQALVAEISLAIAKAKAWAVANPTVDAGAELAVLPLGPR